MGIGKQGRGGEGRVGKGGKGTGNGIRRREEDKGVEKVNEGRGKKWEKRGKERVGM